MMCDIPADVRVDITLTGAIYASVSWRPEKQTWNAFVATEAGNDPWDGPGGPSRETADLGEAIAWARSVAESHASRLREERAQREASDAAAAQAALDARRAARREKDRARRAQSRGDA